ncbi:UNVERIFIED_CONTAM: hypothetical protein GTU68_019662, partial [Idotea baltica]|nr:hypothetical protein [Idotea baltica]
MNISEKELAVESISGKFSDSPAAFLIDYKGCSCEDMVSLRNELRPTGAEFAVVKNTLAKRAIADTGVDELAASFTGPTAVVWTGDDPVTPAKVLTKFVKGQESCSLKSGVVD